MAKVIITLKIMPDSPEANLDDIKGKAIKLIEAASGDVGKVEIEPIAFGLKALMIYMILDEAKGSTEDLENSIAEIENVSSCSVTDVRRAIG
ncbi:MAG: elongation factor 1-beta [archaeon]